MEFGSVRKQGNFTLVCVLAIDNDKKVCATHRLSHPEVPVVQQTLTTWAQIQATIESHLPTKYWDKLWIHASNPCVKASTQNGTNRDLDQAEADMRWLIGCLDNLAPAVWTIENVPPLYQRVRSLAPYCRVIKMQQHCRLCQPRRRLIISSAPLELEEHANEHPTLHQILGPQKGWHPDAPLLQRDAWSAQHRAHILSHGAASI